MWPRSEEGNNPAVKRWLHVPAALPVTAKKSQVGKRIAHQSNLGTIIGILRQGPCTAVRETAASGRGAVGRKGAAAKPCFFENPCAILNTCSDACKPAGINGRKPGVRLFRCMHPGVWAGLKLQGGGWKFRLLQHRRHNAKLEDKSGDLSRRWRAVSAVMIRVAPIPSRPAPAVCLFPPKGR